MVFFVFKVLINRLNSTVHVVTKLTNNMIKNDAL